MNHPEERVPCTKIVWSLNAEQKHGSINARLTAALVDRVIHHAHILSFTGDSYRVKYALSNR